MMLLELELVFFSKCSSITNGITEICSYAFERLTSLTNITIPNSVTKICYSAFEGCSFKNI